MHANSLLSTGSAKALWEQFTDTLDLLEELYPSATITSRMQTTAESGSVPTKTTVSSRLADATGHRVDELTSQYRRVTGERCDVSDPEEICVVLTEWIRENESVVQALLDDATATFDGISLDDPKRCSRWRGTTARSVRVNSLPPPCVSRPKRTRRFETSFGGENPWEQLQSAYDGLQAEQPDSPTTESVETVLGSSRLPSIQRVRQLIEEAKNPKLPGPTTTRGQNYSALPKSSGGSFRTPTLPMT